MKPNERITHLAGVVENIENIIVYLAIFFAVLFLVSFVWLFSLQSNSSMAGYEETCGAYHTIQETVDVHEYCCEGQWYSQHSWGANECPNHYAQYFSEDDWLHDGDWKCKAVDKDGDGFTSVPVSKCKYMILQKVVE